MTATNPHKKRKEGINVFRKDSDDTLPKSPAKESPKKREKRFEEEEVYVKNKITVDDPDPVNVGSRRNSLTYSQGKTFRVKKRPKSKIVKTRKRLPTAKAKFRVKVERNVDPKTVIFCKNNERLKLSTIACPDERTNRIKRLERKLDYEMPLMDKGLQPGSQKSLFPTRKTEQEFMIFREIFIEPKERELEKLKERAKLEREQYEIKRAMRKPKKRVLKTGKAWKYFELDLKKLNTNQHNKNKFEDLISNFKNQLKDQKEREDIVGDCLVEGKQGLELYLNKNYESALSWFTNCLNIGHSLKNSRLRLDCLLWIGYTIKLLLDNKEYAPASLLVRQNNPFAPKNTNWESELLTIAVESLETAYGIAKKAKEIKLAQELMCNLGVLKGSMSMLSCADNPFATLANTESLYNFNEEDDEAIEGEDDSEAKQVKAHTKFDNLMKEIP